MVDRQLLSKILLQMKDHLKNGESIGDMKISALLSLGQQLEAIFYYLGHELGTILKLEQIKDVSQIAEGLKNAIFEYNLGDVEITESSEDVIQLNLKGHSSIKDLINKGIKTETSFCSFEAGLLAGIVENISDIHCFAQELSCSLQSGKDNCKFLIVFQKD